MSDPRLIANHEKEQVGKWDARGALLGLPGPSPPSVSEASISTVTPDDDETVVNLDVVTFDTATEEDFDDRNYGEKVQIADHTRGGKRTGNVAYVVRAVIEDPEEEQESHYLLIQESKEDSKRLKWYLPAGRVKPTESCDEAIIRIVHEEAGIRVLQKLPIILVEEIGPFWLRFTYLIEIQSDQKAKMKHEEDEFSIKAQFWSLDKISSNRRELRGDDMIRAIKVATRVKARKEREDKDVRINYEWNKLTIRPKPKKYVSIRACFIFHDEVDQSHWVIQHRATKSLPNIPGWQALEQKCLHAVILKFLLRIHDKNNLHWYRYKTEGVTCVEHKKAENQNLDPQGMRLTVVFRIKLNEAKTMTAQHRFPKVKADEQYEWVRLEERSTTDAVQEIFRQNILTPLHSPALIKMGHGISTDSKDEQYQTELHLDTWHSNPLFSTAARKGKKAQRGEFA